MQRLLPILGACLFGACGEGTTSFVQLPPEVTEDTVLVWSGGLDNAIEVTEPDEALRRSVDVAHPLELALYDSISQLGLPLGRVESAPDWTERLPAPRASFLLTQADSEWQTTNGLPAGLATVTRPSARNRWCQWSANAPVPLGQADFYSSATDGRTALVDDGTTLLHIRPGSSRGAPQLVDLNMQLSSRLLDGTSTALWTTDGAVLFRLLGSVDDGFVAERELEIDTTIFHAAHRDTTVIITDTIGGVWRQDSDGLIRIGDTIEPAIITVSGDDFYASTRNAIFRVRDDVVQIYQTASRIDPPMAYPQGGLLFGETFDAVGPELKWLQRSGEVRSLVVFPIVSDRLLVAGLDDGFVLHAEFGNFAATSARTYDSVLCDPPQIERQEQTLPLSILAVEPSFVGLRQNPRTREVFLLGLHRD